jgi:hypothetical protein
VKWTKKKKKMKKNKITLLFLLFFLVSCASVDYWRVPVEVPQKIVFDLNQFSEIIVADFFIKKEAKDFDINKELVNYFAAEMKQNFKGKVSSRSISLDNEELIKDKSFWKNLLADSQGAILFTGIADYTLEIRKAILETRKKRADDPFPRDKAIEERRFYTLNLNLYIIETKTGETLYTRLYKEAQGYKNPKQTGPFAFFELVERVKGKFFGSILGGAKIQQRYLIKD